MPCGAKLATEHALVATEKTIDYFPGFYGTGELDDKICQTRISLHFTRRTSHPFIKKMFFDRQSGAFCARTQRTEIFWPWGDSRDEFMRHIQIMTAGAIALRDGRCVTMHPFIKEVEVNEPNPNKSPTGSTLNKSIEKSPVVSPLSRDSMTISASPIEYDIQSSIPVAIISKLFSSASMSPTTAESSGPSTEKSIHSSMSTSDDIIESILPSASATPSPTRIEKQDEKTNIAIEDILGMSAEPSNDIESQPEASLDAHLSYSDRQASLGSKALASADDQMKKEEDSTLIDDSNVPELFENIRNVFGFPSASRYNKGKTPRPTNGDSSSPKDIDHIIGYLLSVGFDFFFESETSDTYILKAI